MAIWDHIEDLVSSISDSVSNSINKINKSDMYGNIKNTFNDISNSNNSNTPIHEFPKLELISRKYKVEKTNVKKLKIEDYEKKYITKSLNKKIKSLSNYEKANIYLFIGKKLKETGRLASKSIEINKLSTKYLERALAIFPENIELAYELFNVFNDSDLHAHDKRGVEIGELCIKLSCNQNIKKEFDKIYTYFGNYYYLENNDYKKALECYEKARSYAEPNSYYYINAEQYMAILYEHLGEYKKSLYWFDSVLKTKAKWIGDHIVEFRNRVKRKVDEGLSKEENDVRVSNSNMNYIFRDSAGHHPEEVFVEAYKHYSKAEELMKNRKRAQAIEEYKKVKELLPEQTKYMDEMISFLIGLGLDEGNSEDQYNELLKVLNERLEIARKTGKGFSSIYNELAIAYAGHKEYDKAIENYKKAIEYAANPTLYYNNLAICYEEMGLYDEAISTFAKIKEINSDAAREFKADYNIMRLKDIMSGKKGKKGEDYQLAFEHCLKGNKAFDNSDYENAYQEFNTAFEINKINLDYVFKKVLVKELYESLYGIETEECFEGILTCEKVDDFDYLPFFLTVYGDCVTYEAWGKTKEALVYYEIATYLLDLSPVNERFAAPYFKLARLKEQDKNYGEALTLFERAHEVDSTYKIQKDVDRVKSFLQEGETANADQENKHLNLVKKYLDTKLYDMVITEGKRALDYAPHNIDVYYYICQGAEQKKSYYDLKWAAKEGLRLSISDFDRTDYFDYFIFVLGQCCKYENKLEQALHYFDIIVECDEYKEKELTHKAEHEADLIRYSGR